tara:strand:+ start:655 stop:1179 length:525 start_codon:yes stop_codon:yes gene_type:complete
MTMLSISPRLVISLLPSIISGSVVVILDQIIKHWVESLLSTEPEPFLWILNPFLKLRLVYNDGLIFGIFSDLDRPWIMTILVLVAISVLSLLYTQQLNAPTTATKLTFGITLGGALGNLVDRLRLGYVVDYMDLGWWPVFNLADAAINVSMVLFLFLLMTGRLEKPSTTHPPSA